jgi:hypothetical protein
MPAPGQSASGGPVGAAGGKPLSVGTGTGGRRRAVSKRGARRHRRGGADLPATTDAAPANSAAPAPALAPMGGRRHRKTARGRRRGGADAAPAPAAAAVAADGAADAADVAAAAPMSAGRRRKVKSAARKLKAGAEEMAEAAAMPGAGSDSDEMAPAMGARRGRGGKKHSKKGLMRYFY